MRARQYPSGNENQFKKIVFFYYTQPFLLINYFKKKIKKFQRFFVHPKFKKSLKTRQNGGFRLAETTKSLLDFGKMVTAQNISNAWTLNFTHL